MSTVTANEPNPQLHMLFVAGDTPKVVRAAFDLAPESFGEERCMISDLDSIIPMMYADSVECLLHEELSDMWYCGLKHHRILKLQSGALRECISVQNPPTKL